MKNQVRRFGRLRVFTSFAPFFLALLAVFAFLAVAGVSHSADVSIQWDANTESDLAGYKVYYGTAARNYSGSVNVGNWTSCTISGLTAGKTYYFAATAYDTGGLESGYSSEVTYTIPGSVPAPNPTGSVAFAVNAGGAKYTTKGNVVYQADTRYSGGWSYRTYASISGTSDPTLYRSGRTGQFSYTIPLANGSYNVNLKFAETSYTAKGRRIFDVLVNGQTVLSRLDLFASAGARRAYDVTIPVSVTSGTLKVQFKAVVNNPVVNAIMVTK